MTVTNKRIDEEEFLRVREEVISQWPTGREYDLDEAIEYQKSLPEYKDFGRGLSKLHERGETVVFPRAGTPIIEQEIALNNTLYESGLPLIPVTPDSFCRLGHYDRAQQGLEESNRTGQPKLNGYPTVVQGVKNTRKMTEATPAAFNQRLTNVGGVRLMADIAFASGMTAALVDPLISFEAYEKESTAAECIREYQYIWRLVGYYTDRGARLTIDIDGAMTNVQFPQSVTIAGIIITALMAAEQGVKSIIPWTLHYGYMAQSIAWARLTRRLNREYLDKFGYNDVVIPGIFLGTVPAFPYPQGMGDALGYLGFDAATAALAEADGVYLRTIDEGAGIPVKEAHAMSYRAAKWIFDVMREQRLSLDNVDEIKTEERITEMEVRAIIDKVLELGDGDVAIGYDKGIEAGIIDYPFSPNTNIKGKAFGTRDVKGACRYLDFGALPIPEEAKEFHRQKVAERKKVEGELDFRTFVDDFWSLSKGKIKSKSIFG